MNTRELQKLITEDGVRGITLNRAIFGNAIDTGANYDKEIKKNLSTESNNDKLLYSVVVKDIQRAADMFMPIYKGKTEGADDYVSLKVSPHFANVNN